MGEVTSAIVASTLVLGAVFAPVALLPGRRACCATRRHGHGRRADLAAQRANALARAVRARHAARREPSRRLPRLRPRLLGVVERYDPACARCFAPALCTRRARGAIRAEPAPVPVGSHGFSRTKTGTSSRASSSPKALRRAHRRGGARGRADPQGNAGSEGVHLFGGFDMLTGTSPPNFGSAPVTLDPWTTLEKGRRSTRSSRTCDRDSRRFPGRALFALNPRRSAGSPGSAASSSSP